MVTGQRDERMEPGAALAALSEILLAEESLDEVLAKVVDLAVRSIPGVEAASITTVLDDHATTSASTGSLALRADEHQYELGRGPCIESALAHEPVLVTDMESDDRWPDYAILARGEGVRSSFSVPLPIQGLSLAALNLYSEEVDAFDDDAQRTAESFARRAGVAVANARHYADVELLAEQLSTAMRTRAVIEQAKGILMAQSNCDAERAFELLVRASQRENVKLRDIATRIVSRVGSQSP